MADMNAPSAATPPMRGTLGVRLLLRHFHGRIAVTWVLVLLEHTLWAFVPLFIGRAIDGAPLDLRIGPLTMSSR